MHRTLTLTSPHVHGQDVKNCQWLLHEHGFHCKVDGDYGVVTASCVLSWKRQFGYPIRSCNGSFGQVAYDFLTKKTKQPLAYKLRAKARKIAAFKRAHSAAGRTQRVMNIAIAQIGTKENPFGSNNVLFSRWYGVRGPWCAMFVSWCCAQIGNRTFRYSFCPNIVHDGIVHRNGLVHVGNPARDVAGLVLALFDWPGESPGEADHVGITLPEWWLISVHPALLKQGVREFGPLHPGEFWTVEGNTSIGNQSNGGEVMLRKRSRSDVQAFVHVVP